MVAVWYPFRSVTGVQTWLGRETRQWWSLHDVIRPGKISVIYLPIKEHNIHKLYLLYSAPLQSTQMDHISREMNLLLTSSSPRIDPAIVHKKCHVQPAGSEEHGPAAALLDTPCLLDRTSSPQFCTTFQPPGCSIGQRNHFAIKPAISAKMHPCSARSPFGTCRTSTRDTISTLATLRPDW